MKPSLSVIIPALNEEKNIGLVVNNFLTAIKQENLESFEIILINDGSSDRTSMVMEKISRVNPNIRVIHHQTNQGLGASVREGYELASKDYVIWSAGDGGMSVDSIAAMMEHCGRQDLVVTYIANADSRSTLRRLTSKAYVLILNSLFGFKLKYYNGSVIYPTKVVQKIKTETFGFFFFAETLIKVLSAGHTYVEIPTHHFIRSHGKSKAFRLKNILETSARILQLRFELKRR